VSVTDIFVRAYCSVVLIGIDFRVFLVLFRFSFYSTCIFTVTSLLHHASVVMFYTHNK